MEVPNAITSTSNGLPNIPALSLNGISNLSNDTPPNSATSTTSTGQLPSAAETNAATAHHSSVTTTSTSNPNSNPGSNGNSNPSSNKNTPRVKEIRHINELFVGDLSYFCTEKDLANLFGKYGGVLATRIKRPDGSSPNSRSLMYGFVCMETLEGAYAAARSLHRSLFMGRFIR